MKDSFSINPVAAQEPKVRFKFPLTLLLLSLFMAATLIGSQFLLGPRIAANKLERMKQSVIILSEGKLTINGLQDMAELYSGKSLILAENSESTAAISKRSRLRLVYFKGPGFWGPVEGLALLTSEQENEFIIQDMIVTEHQETAGIGSRALDSLALARYKGVRARLDDEMISRAKLLPESIDSVTGATVTSERFKGIITRALGRALRECKGLNTANPAWSHSPVMGPRG